MIKLSSQNVPTFYASIINKWICSFRLECSICWHRTNNVRVTMRPIDKAITRARLLCNHFLHNSTLWMTREDYVELECNIETRWLIPFSMEINRCGLEEGGAVGVGDSRTRDPWLAINAELLLYIGNLFDAFNLLHKFHTFRRVTFITIFITSWQVFHANWF